MRRRRSPRDIERPASRPRFVATLRRIADALESESPFLIQVGGERLRVPAGALLTVEHEREGGVEEIELQFRWPCVPRARRR
jgi:amphi-Trp domain-containing protein